MKKIDLYNGLVNLTKKTGQGLAPIIEMKIGSKAINSLISDGLVKRVSVRYSTMPNEEWICLTRGYCVEEDFRNEKWNGRALDFIRYYLSKGVQPKKRKGGIDLEYMAWEGVEKYKELYNEWLEENLEKILETQSTELLVGDSKEESFFTDKELIFLQKRDWYKNNLSLKEAIVKCEEDNRKDRKIIDVTSELRNLYKIKRDIINYQKCDKDLKAKRTSKKKT